MIFFIYRFQGTQEPAEVLGCSVSLPWIPKGSQRVSLGFPRASITEVSTTIKHIRSVTVRGKPWTVQWLPKIDDLGSLGLCTWDYEVIGIKLDQPPKEVLDTVIHEMLHAEFPKMSEEDVARTASEIAGALWRIGFRAT